LRRPRTKEEEKPPSLPSRRKKEKGRGDFLAHSWKKDEKKRGGEEATIFLFGGRGRGKCRYYFTTERLEKRWQLRRQKR